MKGIQRIGGLGLIPVAAALFANCRGESSVRDDGGTSGFAEGGAGMISGTGGNAGENAEHPEVGLGGSAGSGSGGLNQAGTHVGGGEAGVGSGGASGGHLPTVPGGGGQAGDDATAGAASDGGAGGAGGQHEVPEACGNGRVDDGEACDDGGHEAGDGCSRLCEVEPGFSCTAAVCDANEAACRLQLPVTFRDFNAHDVVGGHPDFGPNANSPGAIQALVRPDLDEHGKPVLRAPLVAGAFLHGSEAFAQTR